MLDMAEPIPGLLTYTPPPASQQKAYDYTVVIFTKTKSTWQ